jgi:1-acyl-sn-glycerol-3-phosphate acyltransferase
MRKIAGVLMSDDEKQKIALAESLIFQVARAMALPQTGVVKNLLRWAIGRPARRLAGIAIELDRRLAQDGLAGGARWLMSHFMTSYQACQSELIPQAGPLLIAANHPSSYDALVVSACINRMDYKIIIGDIPPYHFLPNLCRHAIFSPNAQDTFGRMQTLREAILHLENGGALLVFPRGAIEPDPAFMPNPEMEFARWSRSLEIFLRRVPQTRVLVAVVSGVISPKALNHPVTWFRRSRPDRQRLAYIYQIIRQMLSGKELFGLRPRVTFSEMPPVTDPHKILGEVERAARSTLRQHLAGMTRPADTVYLTFKSP